MMDVLRAVARRNAASVPGSDARISRAVDGAGAGIGSVASGSGAKLVARAIISAAAVLLTRVRIVDVRIFQSDGRILHPASRGLQHAGGHRFFRGNLTLSPARRVKSAL